jgi:hypothetical protein
MDGRRRYEFRIVLTIARTSCMAGDLDAQHRAQPDTRDTSLLCPAVAGGAPVG